MAALQIHFFRPVHLFKKKQIQTILSIYFRYDLEANNQILAEEKQKPIFQDLVDNYEVEYTPGGATQNTIRIASVSASQKTLLP